MKAKHFKKLRSKARYYYVVWRRNIDTPWKGNPYDKTQAIKVLAFDEIHAIERMVKRQNIFHESANGTRYTEKFYFSRKKEKDSKFIVMPALRPYEAHAKYYY